MEELFKTVERIIAEHFDLDNDCFWIKSKDRVSTDAKHFLIYILIDVYGFKKQVIMNRYGYPGRTIYASAQTVRDGIRFQPFFKRHYSSIIDELRKVGKILPTEQLDGTLTI